MSDELEKIMRANYEQVFKQLLLSAFKSDPSLAPEFVSQTIERQREIDSEIKKRSEEMADALVSKLKKRGYLEKEPDDTELEALIRSILEEFGTKR
jgi:DNA-directed RNA polymerase specialized sigma54-like protein